MGLGMRRRQASRARSALGNVTHHRLIRASRLGVARLRPFSPEKYEKIARLLQVCADVEKCVATYHGVAVTPQAIVYFWTESAIFVFILTQLISLAPSSIFTHRFLICEASGHHLPWSSDANLAGYVNATTSNATDDA